MASGYLRLSENNMKFNSGIYDFISPSPSFSFDMDEDEEISNINVPDKYVIIDKGVKLAQLDGTAEFGGESVEIISPTIMTCSGISTDSNGLIYTGTAYVATKNGSKIALATLNMIASFSEAVKEGKNIFYFKTIAIIGETVPEE